MEEPELYGHGEPSIVGNTSVESQSTQLLDYVMGRTEPAPAGSDNHRSSNDTSSDHHSKGSGDISYASASVVPYHFHGLASTQTQTDAVDSGGSQKESERASAAQSPSGLATRDARSRTSDCIKPTLTKSPLTSARALSTSAIVEPPLSPHAPPQPTKAALTFLSPVREASLQKEPTKAPTMPRYRRRPSPPIPSQDSFAGPTASQDPDLFIATSRQFDIPLDQLGRPISEELSSVASRVGRSSAASSEQQPIGAAGAAMDDYSLSSSSSPGHILVANSDSSDTSQGSHRNELLSISQQPTQLLSDGSVSEHADVDAGNGNADDEVPDQVADASTRVEPTQDPSREATQVLEESPSAEIGQTSAPGPSVVSDKLSLLSLVAPEKRARYMHHFAHNSDGRSGPTPGPSNASVYVADPPPVVATSTTVSKKRSLLNFVSPERRVRYMHHLKENSALLSEASRMATVGTSLGSGPAKRSKSPMLHAVEENIVEDSVEPTDMDISPVKELKSRDQEIIPPSESEAADCSREEEEEEEDAMLPLAVSAKGKQKANLSSAGSPRVPVGLNRGKISTPGKRGVVVDSSLVGSPRKARTLVPSTQANSMATPAQRNSPASNAPRDVEMAPPPVPPQRGRGRPRIVTKDAGGVNDVPSASPLVSTSAAAMQRDLRPPTPKGHPANAPDSEQDSPEIPLARIVRRRTMEEEESEAGEVEELVLDEDEKAHNSRPGPSTRKRKRRNPALTTKKAGKGKVAAPRKANTRGVSLAPPPTKKARTAIAKRFGAGIGSQVFALFKSDSSFYGAEVHSLNGSRAHVKFFDGLEDPNLGVAQMRRFDLREGDVVIPGNTAHKAKVVDDSLWSSENEVTVEYTEGPEEGLECTVRGDELRIPARVIQSHWKDRMLELSDIIPAVPRKSLKETPSPSKNSVVNVASSRTARNKLLSKYGIIITQGPGNQNWSREKERFINVVKDNGGTVLSDWLDVFSLHGKHSNGNKRWIIQRSDVKYAPKDKNGFDRVFLVSDVHNQKPKYLLALALGIPCVSVQWLDHLASGEELPWSRFLLAAGHSEPLGAPISQMVDLDWGSSSEHLTEIMENSVPLKVLSGASILCIGSDLLPHPAKKCMTDADRSLEASRTVPRIILAMGAERVEAVADAKNASEHLSQYTYVVVKEAIPNPCIRDATYVDVTWIKECLIAGRRLPVPEWE